MSRKPKPSAAPRPRTRPAAATFLATAVLFAIGAGGALAAPKTDAPSTSIVAPSRGEGATVAHLVAPVFARARLDRPRHGRPVAPETEWAGRPTYLLVLAAKSYDGQEWIEILLPDRPNGSTGWIPRERVLLGHTDYWVQVSTHRRRVSVYRSGRRIRSFRAVVGAPATPTPHGLGAVYERNRQPDPHGFSGPWVLALTLLSNKLHSFEGGRGRVGIHGRDGASLLDPLGSARSHGCIRISNGPVRWMAAHVPVGTPVMVSG